MPKGDKVEVRLSLDPKAAELLGVLAGSPRKQGEYVSRLILAAAGQLSQPQSQALERIAALERELGQLRTKLTQQ